MGYAGVVTFNGTPGIPLGDQRMLVRDANGSYQFAHRSFMEFFAALKLAREFDDIRHNLMAIVDEASLFHSATHKDDVGLKEILGQVLLSREIKSFLVGLLAPTASTKLIELLRTGGSSGYADANIASLLTQMGHSLAGENLSRRNLAGADLEGADMRGVLCLATDFRNCDLSNTYLATADLRQANVKGMRFEHVSGVKTVQMRGQTGQFVTESSDGTIEVWALESGKRVRRIRAAAPSLLSGGMCLSNDNELALSTSSGRVRAWNINSGRMDWEIRVTGQPSSIACSHDGTFLALMDFMTGTLTLWNYQTRSLLHSFRPPNARVGYDVSFSPDSVYLAAAHIDGGAVVWETATGKIVAELRGHSSKTESVCFAGRGRYVVTADYKGCVRVWNVGSWNLVQEFKETAAVAHLSAPADGMTLCTATHSGCVGVWDLSEMRQVRLLRGHRGAVYGIANSNDARFLVSTGQDATIRIRDLEADDAETVVVEQSLRCTGMRIGKIRGLDREYRSILLARGAKA